jgi:branched-chain amino acid transport system substrate-binding protein
VLVAVLVAACGHSAQTNLVDVGALYPTTGAQAVGGNEELRGVRLGVEWANAHGGVDGKRIRLLEESTPTAESVSGALRRLVDRGARVVLGSHGSAVSAAAALASRTEHITFFETGAVGHVHAPGAPGRTYFRLSPMGGNLGRAAISFISDELVPGRPLRYAVAEVDDVYGNAVAQGAINEVKRRNGDLVGEFKYDAATLDAPALVRKIADAGADALFVTAYIDDGVAIQRAIVASRIPLLANIGTSSSYCHPAFGRALGADAVGVFASDKPDAADVKPQALQPAARRQLEWVAARYQQVYHEAMGAPALSGFTGAIAVLGHLLPAAGGTDPAKVRTATTRVNVPAGGLPNGSGLSLAPPGGPDAGDNRGATSVIWEWVAPNTRAVVWPPAFANSAIKR